MKTPERLRRMATHAGDESTMNQWRHEPPPLFDESTPWEPAAPLWKDLIVASAVALGLWVAAAVVFG